MQRAWRRRWGKNRQSMLKRTAVPLVATGLIFSVLSAVSANPSGGNITTGQGSITVSGSEMTINQQTDKLGINWNSFDIGVGEKVKFVQPGSQSVALNRVLGSDASQIYGTLEANGKVFLINPNGVVFAPGANVNVGGLIATSSSISDVDFIAGNYSFQGGQGGAIINGGNITATGGNVELLGSIVSNQGVITATGISGDASQGVVRLVGNAVDLAGGSTINATDHVVLRAGADASGAGTVTVAAGTVVAPKTAIYYNPVSYNDNQTRSTIVSNPYKNLLLGTSVTAYMLVNTAADLQNINSNLAGVYALNNDINLAGKSFAPIGNGVGTFNGIFDGDNYNISNLRIVSGDKNIGLFGTTNKASISNVHLKDVNITGTATAQYTYAAGLVGVATDSNISNVSVSGKVQGTNDYVAGIVGRSLRGTISNAHNAADVTATVAGHLLRHAGGVVGFNGQSSTVEGSSNTGLITNKNNWSYTGGIAAGNADNSIVNNSINYGTINGAPSDGSYVGGIVGSNWGETPAGRPVVSNSVNYGKITGDTNSNAGGIAGGQKNGSVIASQNYGEVGAVGKYLGGIVGINFDNALIDRSINYASVTSGPNSSTGGIAGYSINSTISNSQNFGVIRDAYGYTVNYDCLVRMDSGYELNNVIYLNNVKKDGSTELNKNIGGIVGKSVGGSIINVANDGEVISNNTLSNAGGLVGWASNTYIADSVNNADIAGKQKSNIGGAVGFSNAGSQVLRVENNGNINGLDACLALYYGNVGGIVGWNYNSFVDASVNNGSIQGAYARHIGGVAGHSSSSNSSKQALVSNSINTGIVNGQADCTYVGGIVGMNDDAVVNESINNGTITHMGNTVYIGGIAGGNNKGDILGSHNFGMVNGNGTTNYVGGIAGISKNGSLIAQSVNDGLVTLSKICGSLGGIVGVNDNSTVIEVINYGSVLSKANSTYAGGIAGTNKYAGKIIKAVNEGDVTNNGDCAKVAGIVGSNVYNATIEQSYNTGTITALGTTTYTGGIAGWNGENLKAGITNISNSYNTGTIIGGKSCSYTGGLVGYNTGVLANSYSSSNVSSNKGIYNGALIGYSSNLTGFTNLYYDTTLAGSLKAVGNISPKGITGLSHVAMGDVSNFNGWDFSSIWQINAVTGLPSLVF